MGKKKKEGEETVKPVTHKGRGLSVEQRRARKAKRLALRASRVTQKQEEMVGRAARRVGLLPKSAEQLAREQKQAKRDAAARRGNDERVFADALRGVPKTGKPLTAARIAREQRRRWVEGKGWVYQDQETGWMSKRAEKNWKRDSAVRSEVAMAPDTEPRRGQEEREMGWPTAQVAA